MNSRSPTTTATQEDRFGRLRLIGWWDQHKLERARVLVVGCGALGNEVLKNLALLGVRRLVIADRDNVDISNLSAACSSVPRTLASRRWPRPHAAFASCFPTYKCSPSSPTLCISLGWVCSCGPTSYSPDSTTARPGCGSTAPPGSWASPGSRRHRRDQRRSPGLPPGKAPCYECTLGEVDWALLDQRMSCNLLAPGREDSERYRPRYHNSSIIAGIQVQEAVNFCTACRLLASRGFVFEGLNHTSYVVQYTENPDCHKPLPAGGDRASCARTSERTGLLGESLQPAPVEIYMAMPRLRWSSVAMSSTAWCARNAVKTTGTGAGSGRKCALRARLLPALTAPCEWLKTIHSYHGTEDFGQCRLEPTRCAAL